MSSGHVFRGLRAVFGCLGLLSVFVESCSGLTKPVTSSLPGPSRKANRSEKFIDFDGHQKGRENDALSGNGNFSVEKWIQGKTFSRDEVSRLLEIIQSRALEPSNKVEENKFSPQSIGKQVEQLSAANRVLKKPRNEKQEDLEKATFGNLTPHPHSSKLNEVGASPVAVDLQEHT